MKIVHITTIDMALRYLLFNQLRSIQQAGYEVAGISSPGPNVAALETAGLRHIPLAMTRSMSPLDDLAALLRLYRVMRRERFTIVHTHNPKPGLLGQLAARMAGVPIVINTLHGFYFHDAMSPLKRRFYITMEKIAARCSDTILSQNREDIHTAINEGICSREKIEYLGNGIDVQHFDHARLDATLLEQKRRELGLAPGVPVIGFVGRLVAEKGLLELLEAMHIVRQQVPEIRLLIIGAMDQHKADALTPHIARDYGLEEVCIFVGWRHDMPEMYALMDVFVLPSHREGFPRAPMEASAMSVPCIVSDIRGCREAVQPDHNGLLVPLQNSQVLACAIIDIVTNREKARYLGTAGRALALERFDERLVFAKVLATYERLLREQGFAGAEPQQTLREQR
jgi:glycosyltransferase involved in cell wall biosynthesis